MTENKTTMNGRSRQAYEPVKVKLMKVTPQGVLCQSGGLVGGPLMTNWGGGSSSSGSI